ncbi:hypothetical protein [Kitasatospora sp. NPDC088779]|uniref:hypothetical protein n=1 Tax=unclassified Kitasatospora TaxID=2633591 RepID=UPI00343507C5
MTTSSTAGTPLERAVDDFADFVRVRLAERAADPAVTEQTRAAFARQSIAISRIVADAWFVGSPQQIHALRLLREMSLLWYGHDDHPDTPWHEHLATTDPDTALRHLQQAQRRADDMTD